MDNQKINELVTLGWQAADRRALKTFASKHTETMEGTAEERWQALKRYVPDYVSFHVAQPPRLFVPSVETGHVPVRNLMVCQHIEEVEQKNV